MSLIDDIVKNIHKRATTAHATDDGDMYVTITLAEVEVILEKHLQQSESKSIDDLIEKYKDMKNGKPKILDPIDCGIVAMLGVIIKDLENLKQSEKVVDEKELEVLREKARKYDKLCK